MEFYFNFYYSKLSLIAFRLVNVLITNLLIEINILIFIFSFLPYLIFKKKIILLISRLCFNYSYVNNYITSHNVLLFQVYKHVIIIIFIIIIIIII